MKKNIKITLAIILTGRAILIFYLFMNSSNYKNFCENISNVDSIVVAGDSIRIQFNTSSGGFNLVGKKSKFGTTEPLEYNSTYTIQKGGNIWWGDGDHVTYYLTLKDIKEKDAYIVIKDEFTWMGEIESSTQECIIPSIYPLLKLQ